MRIVQDRSSPVLCSILASAALGGLWSCGSDDALEPAELDEICGEPGPVRILELDADRPLVSVLQFAALEGRRILEVSYLDEINSDTIPLGEQLEIWSVGECGETPRRISEDDP